MNRREFLVGSGALAIRVHDVRNGRKVVFERTFA